MTASIIRLRIKASGFETEFETVIAENKEITTVVLEGYVEIAPPGRKPFVLEKGQTYTWSGNN